MQDFHSGGTVCSPTRASVLTGRNHFRDCMNYVFDCSDMTECIPPTQCDGGGGSCTFAPQGTFTVADAARAAGAEYESAFFGKWHLGSLYNDSEAFGGYSSSPKTHGFDYFNCTVEVAPTATTNAQCRIDWNETVDYGHYLGPNHCAGGANPGGGGLPDGWSVERGATRCPHRPPSLLPPRPLSSPCTPTPHPHPQLLQLLVAQ